MAKTYKVSTVEVSAQSRKEWLARKRGKGDVAASAAAVVVQSEASSAPSALDALFRQVNIGTDDAPKYVAEALFPLRIGDALLDWHAEQKYLGVEHATESEKANFFATGGVTAGGIGSSSGGGTGGGGSSTLAGLNDVALKSAIANDMLVYNGTHWVNTPMSAIKPDLTAYATKSWVEGKGYALNTALLAVDARLANVETIFTADQDGAINKWSEVVAFLDGIEGDTLDSILAQFATKDSLSGYLPLTGGTLTGNLTAPTFIGNLQGKADRVYTKHLGDLNSVLTDSDFSGWGIYASDFSATATNFPHSGNKNNANGVITFSFTNHGQSTGIYGYQLARTDVSDSLYYRGFNAGKIKRDWRKIAFTDDIPTIPTKLSQFTDDVVKDKYLPIDGTAKNAGKLGDQAPTYYATATALTELSDDVTEFRTLFNSLFEKDTANNAIKAKLSLYSVGGITAGGIGSGGSSGGGGASYNRLDAWADYTNDKSGWVLSALLGKDLDTRVSALANAGYITASALDPYAKSADVANTYATQTALQGVDIRVQAIEYIFDEDQDGVINKWQEIVDFLAGVEGTTLDGILEQFATKDSLAGYMPKTGGTFSGDVTAPTFIGNLTGNATNALALKGIHAGYENGRGGIPIVESSGVMEIGKYIDFHTLDEGDGVDYSLRIECQGAFRNRVYFPTTTGTLALTSDIPTKLSQLTDDVVSGKYLPINGTAPNANTLNWASFTKASGIGFNLHQWFASGKVSDIPSMGYSTVWQAGLNMSRAWQIWVSRTDHATHTRHTDGTNWTEEYTLLDDHNYTNYTVPKTGGTFSGNVGIGTTDPAEKLDVVGNIKTSGSVRIGDAILSWDATNKCVTIKNANTGEKASLLVDGGVTATAIN